ncbi:hypothetical protein C8R44DRAFT_819498 [Mycena epipterygia]|nr:hypothetical protein C8R44DRAFT_819498 [Mycena epipterygia]
MPVNVLPPELLLSIFEHGTSSPPDAIGGSTFLLIVSQVCSLWHGVTESYPTLWDDLRLSGNSSPAKAKYLLTRSQRYPFQGAPIPIPISVTIDRRTTPADPIAYWNMLNVVTAQAERIQVLRFVGQAASLGVLSRACVRHRFPQLRELVVIESAEAPPGGSSFWTISIDAPNLTSSSFTRTAPLVKTRFTTLRHLHLDESGYFVHFDQPESVLEPQLLALETLSITASPLPLLLDPAIYPMDSNIVCLTLSSLRPDDVPPGTLMRFLHLVRTPLLQSLEFCGLADYLLHEFLQSLRGGLHGAPKYPVLRTLTLRALSLAGVDGSLWRAAFDSDADSADSLHAVQTISEIRLDGVDPLPLMRLLKAHPRVCPKVREIRFGRGAALRLRLKSREGRQ